MRETNGERVIDACFELYASWIRGDNEREGDRFSDRMNRLFQALNDYDPDRAHRIFQYALRQARNQM